ncbi:MAG TPA: four-helix bundle copper-binding protein [Acidimicrobiales bacterium]|nr:four-helix bundle copper-binding protein [Acidimicrobiales bacterium]
MSYAKQMLQANSQALEVEPSSLSEAIDAIDDCVQACIADVDYDLAEPNVNEMVECIRLCLNCADICGTTARVLSRQSGSDADLTKSLLMTCESISNLCGGECERHAHHEHCRICAEACRRCEKACRELVSALV